MDIISTEFLNLARIPWRTKKEPVVIRGPFLTQEVSWETEPLEITVKGRTTSVVFDIVDMPSDRRMGIILGRPWHASYDPDIDWTGGGHLRPRPRKHLTDRADTPEERSLDTDSSRVPSEDSHHHQENGCHTLDERDVAVVSIDEDGVLQHQGDINWWEVVAIMPDKEDSVRLWQDAAAASTSQPKRTDKFAYYEGHEQKSTDPVPKEYRNHPAFKSKHLTGLPDRGPWDHDIKLKEGAQLKFFKVYHTNEKQSAELKKYIEENLARGHIRKSTSPAGYPVLFVPKKDGSLRMCVDYRQLNDQTVKNRYPLPLISRLRDQLVGARYFTRLDLPVAYAHIRIREGDEWKTAFRTAFGHYEYQVLPFGLTNAPATFQSAIDHAIRPFLDRTAVCYLDDILIFSKTLDEYKRHVKEVLDALHAHNLSVNREKSEFHKHETVFLGYLISPGEIRMEPSKIDAVAKWPAPQNVTETRGFVGFANFYRMFIRDFGGICKPLHDLTRKDQEFVWRKEHQQAFERIKELIAKDPVLKLPDPSLPYEVETDASDFALGGVLGQKHDGKLHPVAFFSKKLSGAPLNYPVHDKELMAIVEAFKEWRPYLSGTTHEVKVYTDHKNLTYFTTMKVLNGRQVR